jgi:hypothetical protein
MADDVFEQAGSLTVRRHADDVVTRSVARAVMGADTRRELGSCRVDRAEQPRGLGDRGIRI